HFSANVSQTDGLEELGVLLASQEGTLTIPGISERVDRFNLFATYRPLEDLIDLGRLDVETARLNSVATGEIRHVLTENRLRQLDLEAASLELDLSPSSLLAFSVLQRDPLRDNKQSPFRWSPLKTEAINRNRASSTRVGHGAFNVVAEHTKLNGALRKEIGKRANRCHQQQGEYAEDL
ncbi:MAG: hypothetical protein AAFO63_02660, partial [Pseudomonadota bacterium]